MSPLDLNGPSEAPPALQQRPRRPGVKRISLALQGGGSHGAFTWGVMHRLISDPRLYIDGISGTSAGAMNGVVFAGGFITGKRQGAIDALAEFWSRIADLCSVRRSFIRGIPGLTDGWQVDNDPSFMLVDFMTRIWAPTQLNPLNMNPLRDVLEDLVDFEGLRARPDVKLFVTASNVRTCKSRVFRTAELTADALLASACMPLTFKAIEIDGEAYWDGGYLGNPAIYPLINECASSDVVIVQINPMNRPDIPVSARSPPCRAWSRAASSTTSATTPCAFTRSAPNPSWRNSARSASSTPSGRFSSTCTTSAMPRRKAGSPRISTASVGTARSTCSTSTSDLPLQVR